MSHTRSLRLALLTNALFSLGTGLWLAAAPAEVGAWLGIDALSALRGLGAILVAFAVSLIVQAVPQRQSGARALLVSALDASWVVATVVALILFGDALSGRAIATIAVVAAAVAGFMAWQLLAIARLYRVTPAAGLYRVCVAVDADVTVDRMWTVVADIGSIRRYMPALRSSTLLDGAQPGVGAVRSCANHDGQQWTERCARWEPGRSFDVDFDTTAETFPFPFATMRGGWVVDPREGGSVVRVWWEVTPRRRWLAPLLFPLMELAVRRDFRGVVGRMAAAASGEPRPETTSRPTRAYAC